MRQIVIPRYGRPDVLEIREQADPQAGPGELRIRVRAAGINFADIMARKGLYPDAPPLPCVVGYEVAGEVDQVGSGVDSGLVGCSVLAMTRFQGYSDVLCVPVKQTWEIPESLSMEQAAAIPVNYLTAWQLLVVMGSLHADESVLIQNAGGGVGLAALDIARHIGARTFGTASPGKHEFLRERGLEHALDYRSGDWLAELKRLTDDRGVELAIDPIGGESWKQSKAALRHTGRLGMFGVSAASKSSLGAKLSLLKILAQMPLFHPVSLMNQNLGAFGVNMGHLWHETEKISGWMAQIIDGVREGWIRPHVDSAFPFEQAAEAHQYIEARKNIGKVVLTP